MNPLGIFDRRFRGFRVVEIAGLGILLALALIVYMAKTHAGGERADITRIQQQIAGEHERIALLRAEVAELERPERLGALAHYLGLAPVPASHEIDPDALASVAHAAPPTPKADPQGAAPANSAAPAAPPAPVAVAKATPHPPKTPPDTDAGDALADTAAATGSPQAAPRGAQ